MMGFVYRWGVRIKNLGERVRSGRVQRLGLRITGLAPGMAVAGRRA